MMTTQNHPLIADYLARLQTIATARLSPDAARELLADISEHLAGAAEQAQSDVDIAHAIERLGRPEAVVAAAAGEEAAASGSSAVPVADSIWWDRLGVTGAVLAVLLGSVPGFRSLLLLTGFALLLTTRRVGGRPRALAVTAYAVALLGPLATTLALAPLGVPSAGWTAWAVTLLTVTLLSLPAWRALDTDAVAADPARRDKAGLVLLVGALVLAWVTTAAVLLVNVNVWSAFLFPWVPATVGLMLLLISTRWSVAQKVLGSLLLFAMGLPFITLALLPGIIPDYFLGRGESCSQQLDAAGNAIGETVCTGGGTLAGPVGTAVMSALLIALIVAQTWVARRLWRRAAA